MTMTRAACSIQIVTLSLADPPCRLALVAAPNMGWVEDMCAAGISPGTEVRDVTAQLPALRVGRPLDARLLGDKLKADALLLSASCGVDLRESPRIDSRTNTPVNMGDFPVFVVADGIRSAASLPAGVILCPADREAIRHNVRAALAALSALSALREEHGQLRRIHDEQAAAYAELLSRQAALEQAAREAYLVKNAIVRNVSHELKTPMLHLKSAISQLAEEQETSLLTRYATNATVRLEEIIQNIVQLSRWVDIRREPMLMGDSVELAMRALRRSWANRDKVNRVDIRLSESLPPVEGDKQGIATVLQLLIDNALKFSKQTVTVSVKVRGAQIIASISDRGIGIPATELSRISNGFYQVDGDDTRAYGGVGIGLAIASLILDRHEAHLDIESEPNQGSTFSFSLPTMPMDRL